MQKYVEKEIDEDKLFSRKVKGGDWENWYHCYSTLYIFVFRKGAEKKGLEQFQDSVSCEEMNKGEIVDVEVDERGGAFTYQREHKTRKILSFFFFFLA